jgi:hypothetical protein
MGLHESGFCGLGHLVASPHVFDALELLDAVQRRDSAYLC